MNNYDWLEKCGRCGATLPSPRKETEQHGKIHARGETKQPQATARPFKTCPNCEKKVRLADNECWNCHSKAVAQYEPDAEVEKRIIIENNDAEATALMKRCRQLYSKYLADKVYFLRDEDVHGFTDTLRDVSKLRGNDEAIRLVKEIGKHMSSDAWNRPDFQFAAKLALDEIQQPGYWVKGKRWIP